MSIFLKRPQTLVATLLGCAALLGCTTEPDCVEVPTGLVVSDLASGKVESEPLPRCKTNWARPIEDIAIESDDDKLSPVEIIAPSSPLPGDDEVSSADTSRADADGNGELRESGADIPSGQNMGASSSGQSATQRTEAVARNGTAVSASAIDNGQGVSISRKPDGGFSISFTGTDN